MPRPLKIVCRPRRTMPDPGAVLAAAMPRAEATATAGARAPVSPQDCAGPGREGTDPGARRQAARPADPGPRPRPRLRNPRNT